MTKTKEKQNQNFHLIRDFKQKHINYDVLLWKVSENKFSEIFHHHGCLYLQTQPRYFFVKYKLTGLRGKFLRAWDLASPESAGLRGAPFSSARGCTDLRLKGLKCPGPKSRSAVSDVLKVFQALFFLHKNGDIERKKNER